ncbi:hypothetical protein C0J52_12949 [Blattella germanica]|nr:hypothetical protein C0J52_12949 [Blattella germanica]
MHIGIESSSEEEDDDGEGQGEQSLNSWMIRGSCPVGDRKKKVPSLDPLHIVNIELDERGFILNLNDITVAGFKDSDIHDLKYDFENQIFSMYLTVPRLEMTGKYNVKGKLLLIPISGNGDVNATLVNTKMWVDVKFQIKTFDGKSYIVKDEPAVRTEPKRAYIRFENLFNGNKVLGDQINVFIDANWQDVYKELSPVLMQALGNIIISITNKFERTATFDELFPEKNH